MMTVHPQPPAPCSTAVTPCKTSLKMLTPLSDDRLPSHPICTNMIKSKRERDDEDEVSQAVADLGCTLERDLPLLKLRALDRVAGLLARDDGQYTTHKALVREDAPYYLVRLAQDPSGAVAARAAEAIVRLASHSAAALARLAAGPFKGLENAPGRLLLNPVQHALVEQGAVTALVPLVLSGQEALAGPAGDALSTLCSFNHEGKVAYMEQLVEAMQGGSWQAASPLDTLLGGVECGSEEVQQLLEQLEEPLLRCLKSSSTPSQLPDCLGLLGTLLEKLPDLADSYREAGAVKALANIIMQGIPEEQDPAVHCLWLLTKDDRTLLGTDSEAMPRDVVALAGSLVLLVKAAEEEERQKAQEEEQQDRAGGGRGSDSDEQDGGAAYPGAGAGQYPPPQLDICYADEASKLLQELVVQHPEVEALVERSGVEAMPKKASCCMM